MRKRILLLVITTLSHVLQAQSDSVAISEIKKFQKELDDEYLNRNTSPLEPKQFKKFKGHLFFPIDLSYRVRAKIVLTPDEKFFPMQTSTNQPRLHRKYANLVFVLHGIPCLLPVYQSKDLMNTVEYADYLFLPFTDITNDETTYHGGRYIGLRIPKEGNELILDFNQAYHPYCAYSKNYSCPIVPEANYLPVKVEAGALEIQPVGKFKYQRVILTPKGRGEIVFGVYNEEVACRFISPLESRI
jgi:uncharacterized protein (DUF1684 family)